MDTQTTVRLGGFAVGAAVYAVRGRSSQVFGRSFYRGDRSQPRIALTFDDGPCRSTPALLDLLAKHGVSATFFMCGQNVQRFPEIARAVHAAGHEIGNHSHSHPYMCFKSAAFVHAELSAAQEAIRQTTGVTPRWFRAPFGVRWFGVRAAQNRLGLTGVMWNVLGKDWKWPGKRVTRRILRKAGNGSIVCLHDGRRLQAAPDIAATLEAVAAVIPQLKDRGLRFVTVTEMLGRA